MDTTASNGSAPGRGRAQLVVVLPGTQKSNLKLIKSALEAHKRFDKRQGINIDPSTRQITLATLVYVSTDDYNESLSLGRGLALLDLSDDADLTPFMATPSLSFALVRCEPTDASLSIYKNSGDHPLVSHVKTYLASSNLSSCQIDALVSTIPKRYSIYEPMVLFTSGSFNTPSWQTYFESSSVKDAFFQSLLINSMKIFGKPSTISSTITTITTKIPFPPSRLISHFAENAPIIESDILRRPTSLAPLYGDFGPTYTPELSLHPTSTDFDQALWVSTIQNGLKQVWSPRFTMFSRGNIKEKARIIQNFNIDQSVKHQTIVDVYAGIGYFVFSYRHLGAKQVLCWEINPWSVEGLRRGAIANGWKCKVVQVEAEIQEFVNTGYPDYDLVVFLESNEMAVDRVIRHINQTTINNNTPQLTRPTHFNMGLLPDSKQSYPTVIKLALLDYPLVSSSHASPKFHVHENVSIHIMDQWGIETAQAFNSIIADLRTNQNSESSNEEDTAFRAAVNTQWLMDPRLEVRFIYVEKIKTFAPDIWHVCGDFELVINELL